MSRSYHGNERRFWEDRIRGRERYSAIGRRSLPERINRARKEALFSVLDAVLGPGGPTLEGARILDAGCGTGVYSEYYARLGARVVGVDLSAEGVRATREHGVPGHFLAASLARLPFSGSPFHVVHVFSVLYHVVDDEAWRESLTELARVLHPGGLLVMRIEWVAETARLADHVKHRSRDAYLRILTEEEGLELVEVHPFRDVVPGAPLVAAAHRFLPGPVAETVGALVDQLDLLRQNPDQKVVVFRKT